MVARMGGSGAHPARCWAQTRPGHARRGPLGSGPTSPPCRGRAGHCPSPAAPPPRRPCFRGEGRWVPEGGTELGVGPGAAVQEPLPPHRRRTAHKTHTRAHTQCESPSRGCRNWPQAAFPTALASKLHLGVTWLLPFRRGRGPRPFSYFQAEYRAWNGMVRDGGKEYLCLPAGLNCGV